MAADKRSFVLAQQPALPGSAGCSASPPHPIEPHAPQCNLAFDRISLKGGRKGGGGGMGSTIGLGLPLGMLGGGPGFL